MFDNIDLPGQMMLLLGATSIAAILTKVFFAAVRLPPVVGFLAIGLGLRWLHLQWDVLSAPAEQMYDVLSNVGIACLLFRVGLESNLKGLMEQLGRASYIWVGDFLVSGLLGFSVAYWLLDLGLPTSLIIGTALTATSVGVSVAVWQSEKSLRSPNGQLMVDVAELDDVSGVLLMGVLFAVLPLLKEGNTANIGPVLATTAGSFFIRLTAFLSFCFLFSRFVEQRLTQIYAGLGPRHYLMILVVGTAFLISGLAAALGFSIAIGAFFAGLMFSRDPQAVKVDGDFSSLYEFFSPFFFIQIGLSVDINSLGPAIGLGLILLIPATLGKMIGNGGPSWLLVGGTSAILIGTSMIPRAEIAMVIVQHGLELGPWAMPPQVFAAMVFVSLATCTLSPIAVTILLRRWPQKEPASDTA